MPLSVRRTARVALLGPSPQGARELWYVLHGYGQLAASFLEDFRAVDDGVRLLVAPEALSRFYEGDVQARLHKDAAVGASWMTREDRTAEIADYLGYLDTLHQAMLAAIGGATPPVVTVLGFSQGGATAARWVASGRVTAARLVVWGSQFPPELDLADPAAPLRRAETTVVIGTKDIFATPKIVAKERSRLDDDTLRAL